MKVLMVSKSQVSAAYHGKLRELARLGVNLSVIVPPSWGNDQLEIWHSDQYEIRVSNIVFSGYNHFHFHSSCPDIVEFDLIHLEEEPWSVVTYQLMRHCRQFRKPALFFTWQNIYKQFPPPFRWIEKFTFAHAAGAIAGSSDAREVIRNKGYSGRIAVIPQLGVDPHIFCKQNSSELRCRLRISNNFIVGFLGRVIEEKGVADLLLAFSRLPSKSVLVVVGEGKFKKKARELAAELGVQERIRWIPNVSSLEVPAYMNLFDALVLPSRTAANWKEQFGRVLIEAMACETPVVASDSGEIPNVIGDAGLVFPEGQVNALVTALTSLIQSTELAASLGKLGRGRVLDLFTHGKIAADTLRFYSNVLSDSESRSWLTRVQ